MSHKRATPKDTKPIDTDAMGYSDREHEHGQHLPPNHPQRVRDIGRDPGRPSYVRPMGANGGTVEFSTAQRRAVLAAMNREPRLTKARRVAATVRRVLLWTVTGVIVAGGIAALVGWWTS